MNQGSPPPSYTTSFRAYLEKSTLRSLRLSCESNSGWLELLEHLPPSFEKLTLELKTHERSRNYERISAVKAAKEELALVLAHLPPGSKSGFVVELLYEQGATRLANEELGGLAEVWKEQGVHLKFGELELRRAVRRCTDRPWWM